MAKGDLLRKHIQHFEIALTAISKQHVECNQNDTKRAFACDCTLGEAWRYFRRLQIEVEKKVYRVK